MTIPDLMGQPPAQRVYWTTDSENGRIEDQARLRLADDETTASRLCIKRMQQLLDPAIEFETVLATGCECWSVVPRSMDLGRLERHVRELGLETEDVSLRYDHHGDPNEVWIAIRATVLTVRETGRLL